MQLAVFLPGVAERLANLFQGSFYLVFTSIHEVMIHNAATAKPEDLRRVLEDTVRDTTPEEDFLTLNIYFYDRDTGQFSLCQTQEQKKSDILERQGKCTGSDEKITQGKSMHILS